MREIVSIAVCFMILMLSSPKVQAENHMTEQEVRKAREYLSSGDARGIPAFRTHADLFHWTDYYMVSKIFFEGGSLLHDTQMKDEAVFWFYAGQLRGRLEASFDPEPSRSSALLASLQEVIGSVVNEYAGADLNKWIAIIDKVIEWDSHHKFKPKSEIFGNQIDPNAWNKEYEEILTGLKKMRAQLAAENPEEWKAKRRANGLE